MAVGNPHGLYVSAGEAGSAGPSSPRPSAAPLGQGTSAAAAVNDFDEQALDDIRRYESFSTVDWIADSTRERARLARARLREGSASALDTGWGKAHRRPPRWWPTGFWGRRAWAVWLVLKQAGEAATDSAVVVIVGILIGVNMAIISIATEWASDLKQGYCSAGWWLNQKFCCWEMMDPAGPGGSVVPPAAVKAAAAAAAAAASSSASSSLAAANATGNATLPRYFSDAASSLLERAVSLSGHGLLVARAETQQSLDLSETCTDWVPWSSWTFPAWIFYVLFSAGLAALCAHLVRSFAPYAAGSGISEIKCILAGFIINGFLGIWTFAIKSLTLPLAIASGLSVGKEGPAVHVACCIGNIVAQFFRSFDRSQARMRELLTAASAAGVAVAFGSPIGGVLFSFEEMAYNFPATTMWRSFLCALAATVTLSFMNPFRTGKLVLFQVSYDRDWHYFEILFYSIIGVFGGLYGAFVIRYNLQVQQFRRTNLAAHGVAEAVTLATLTAFVGYWNKFLRIDMTESLEILFRECEGGGDYDNLCQSSAQWRMVNSLLLATVLRAGLVILSYGCKVPAGIFVPSMAIGATFGRMIGILVKALYNAYPNASLFSACQPDVPCITPGTYAFLGAAAALAGVTRITVAVVVIMFELTGALTYILPTMLVVMITKGVGDLYGKGGISEQMIRFQGYPFLDKDEHVFGLPVSDVMTRAPAVLYGNGTELDHIETRLATGPYKGLPVVRSESDWTLLGYAGKTELRYAIAKARRVRSSLSPSMLCRFTSDADQEASHPITAQLVPTPLLSSFDQAEDEEELAAAAAADTRSGDRQGLMGGLHHDDDEGSEHDDVLGDAEGGIDGEGAQDVLELGGWMEQTPLCVQPSMPLEVVMDLFKKMGPRIILVTRLGRLEGLVTVKDVLKHVAAQEHAAQLAASAARDTRSGQGLPSASSRHAGAASASSSASGIDFGGDLELALSDAYQWVRSWAKPLVARFSGLLPERVGPRRGPPMPSRSGYSDTPRSRNARGAHASTPSMTEDEQEHFILGGEGEEEH